MMVIWSPSCPAKARHPALARPSQARSAGTPAGACRRAGLRPDPLAVDDAVRGWRIAQDQSRTLRQSPALFAHGGRSTVGTTLIPHPEERSAGPRLEG